MRRAPRSYTARGVVAHLRDEVLPRRPVHHVEHELREAESQQKLAAAAVPTAVAKVDATRSGAARSKADASAAEEALTEAEADKALTETGSFRSMRIEGAKNAA